MCDIFVSLVPLFLVTKDLAAKLDIEQEESRKWKIEAEEVEKNMEKQKELMEKQRLEEVELLQQRIKGRSLQILLFPHVMHIVSKKE